MRQSGFLTKILFTSNVKTINASVLQFILDRNLFIYQSLKLLFCENTSEVLAELSTSFQGVDDEYMLNYKYLLR